MERRKVKIGDGREREDERKRREWKKKKLKEIIRKGKEVK